MDQHKEFNTAGGFPNELRVLAVDDDATSLKILERLLLDCGYKVTATQYALHALKMLRENKDEYDVVITDVNMPDMDGFKLLEIVGLEMDLPVIMLSIDCGVKSVMKGIMHGAVDYLVKPVRLEELKVIWKHVARRSLNELIDSNYPSNKLDHTPVLENDRNSKLIKKRKNQRKVRDYDYSSDFDEDAASEKKPRVTWSANLHGKFINAINQLGLDRAVPKKILDIMNTPELSRENVASHLQKHRRGLKKTGVGLGQNISSDAGTNRYDGKPIYVNSNKQYPNITSFGSFGTNGYKSMSPVSTLFSSQGPHSGHGNMHSSWFPPLFNHYDDIVGQCTISPQASQLGTQKPGPINSSIVKAPTQASFNEFSYESFTPRSNQLNSLTQISQIPLPYHTTKYNLGSNQQLGYVLHCQNTDMLSDSNLLERNHLNECSSVQLNAMDQLEMGPFREPLDVQTNNPEDLKKGSPLNLTIPAEKSSTEIDFFLNDIEYEDDLHTALKQFNSKNV